MNFFLHVIIIYYNNWLISKQHCYHAFCSTDVTHCEQSHHGEGWKANGTIKKVSDPTRLITRKTLKKAKIDDKYETMLYSNDF